MCASKASNCAGMPSSPVRKKSRPGLADRPHARLRGELVDHRDRLVEPPGRRVRRRLVRVDRDRREDAGVGCRGLRRPHARLDVATGLHDADDADRGRALELLVERQRLVAVGDLEVRVVVVDRHRERLGRVGPAHVALPVVVALADVLARVGHRVRRARGRPSAVIRSARRAGRAARGRSPTAPGCSDAPRPGLADRLVAAGARASRPRRARSTASRWRSA